MLSKNTGIINKSTCCLLLFFISVSSGTLETYHKFEVGGAVSFNTFNKSFSALLMENAGYNLTPFLNFSISGEQQFRNRSFVNNNYFGSEYRFDISNFQIPLGIIFGFKTVHIGSFYQFIPILGVNSGLYYELLPHVQLRAVYRGKLFFDTIKVWGNDFLLGFSFLFVPMKNEKQ